LNYNKEAALEIINKNISKIQFPKIKADDNIVQIFNEEFYNVYEMHEIIKSQNDKLEVVNFILDIIFSDTEEVSSEIIDNITSFLYGYDGSVFLPYMNTENILKIYNKIFDNKILNENNELIIRWSDIEYLYSTNDEQTKQKNKVNTIIIDNLKNRISKINNDRNAVDDIIYGNKQVINKFVRNFYSKINESVKSVIMMLAIIKYCDSKNEIEKKNFNLNFENQKNINTILKLFKKRKNEFQKLMEDLYERDNTEAIAVFLPKLISNLLSQGESLADLQDNEVFTKFTLKILNSDKYNYFKRALSFSDFFQYHQLKEIKNTMEKTKLGLEKNNLLNSIKEGKEDILEGNNVKKIILLNLEKIKQLSKKELHDGGLDLHEFNSNDMSIAYSKKEMVIMLNHEDSHLINEHDVANIIVKTALYYNEKQRPPREVFDYLQKEINALFLYSKLNKKDEKNNLRKAKI
jgi:hypothetical protein